MPKEVFDSDYRFLRHADLLTFEEIARLAQSFVQHGVEKIRLTGGEPLLRKDLHKLIAMLSRSADTQRRSDRYRVDDQRFDTGAQGATVGRRRTEANHRFARRARRCNISSHERCRFSGA